MTEDVELYREVPDPQTDSMMAPLLKMGLVRKISSGLGTVIKYEITPLGLQSIVHFEDNQLSIGHLQTFEKNILVPGEVMTLLRTLKPAMIAEQHVPLTDVCLLIPAMNESKNIELLLRDIRISLPSLSEIVVVDGGSEDDTALVASNLGAEVITQTESGKGDALRQGFAHSHQGSIIVIMDADGSMLPEEIPRLVDTITKGADIAKGSRFLKGGGSTDISLIRRIGNKFFVSLVNSVWRGHYTDLCYGFMAFKKSSLAQLAPSLESKYFQIETEICIKALRLGLNVVEVPSIELERRHGSSKLRGVHDSARIMKTIIREFADSLYRMITLKPSLQRTMENHPRA